MSQFLHVGVWFNPFAIKLHKLANILRTMYRLLHSVISVGVYCFAFSLLTSQIQFFVSFGYTRAFSENSVSSQLRFSAAKSVKMDKYLKRKKESSTCCSEDNTSLQTNSRCSHLQVK